MLSAALTSLLLAAPPVAPIPDLIPLGHRYSKHELVLEEHALFDRYRFLAGPALGLGDWQAVEPGRPFRFSTKYGTRLFALPPDYEPPARPPRTEDYPEGWPEDFLVGAMPLYEVKSVPILSPVHEVRTTLRIAEVTDGRMVLEVVDEVRTGRAGGPFGGSALVFLVALTLVGVGGLRWLARGRAAGSGAAT